MIRTLLTVRFSTVQLALLLVALAAIAVTAGVALEHVSALGSLSDHPGNGHCKGCN